MAQLTPRASQLVKDADAIDEALNAALVVLQEHLGQTDGGYAAHYWMGEQQEAFRLLMQPYLDSERKYKREHGDTELEPGDPCPECGENFEATAGALADGKIYVLCPNCGFDSSPADDEPESKLVYAIDLDNTAIWGVKCRSRRRGVKCWLTVDGYPFEGTKKDAEVHASRCNADATGTVEFWAEEY